MLKSELHDREGHPTICAPTSDCHGAGKCPGSSESSIAVPVPQIADEEEEPQSKHFTSTRNACKLCTPLGACLVFRGVEGCIPLLHGSQGCSTYIRRYLISHFREPIDIASSNFHEESAIFGGSKNFTQAALNISRQYQPQLIGAASTCLAETIGEDMGRLIHDLQEDCGAGAAAPIVHVSTASYRGTHMDGFHAAVRELVNQLASGGERNKTLAVFPGMVSPADLRYLKEVLTDFGLQFTLLPDYSETMDGGTWSEYEKLQAGGTSIADIRGLGCARAAMELGRTLEGGDSAGMVLQNRFAVPRLLLGLPIGIRESDRFFHSLAGMGGCDIPVKHQRERGRLVDSLIDGHKYVFEKRAFVFGEEDLVIGLTALLCEMGVTPVLCASGGRSRQLEKCLRAAVPDLPAETLVKEGFDFAEIGEAAPNLKPDFLIGSSKGYAVARKWKVPLIRVGFPIHDRVGGQRVLHLGYRGAQELFDRIVNTLLERKQDQSPIGYSYL